MQPVPPGLPGELYIGGDGLARGYRNRPELTAQAFVPDPFSGVPGARLYRSGDIVRWREDGAIEFLGRRDDQVKIRGHRIELGEIEAALLGHPAVQLAAVVVHEFGPQDKRLVAYCQTAAPPSELRSWLAAKLPEYLIPNHFVPLDSLPRLSSGKIDRKALAQRPIPAAAAAEHLPRTRTEQRLARLFAEVLRVPAVGIHDNFFERGGHSLLAMQCLARIAAEGLPGVSIQSFYENPSVAALAALMDVSPAQTLASSCAVIPRREGAGPRPASSAQTRLWLEHQLNPLSPQYNLPYQITLRGPLDVEALRRSLEFLVERHEPLRTVFSFQDGRLTQTILPAPPIELPVTDVADGTMDELLCAAATKCFDLGRDLPWRACLIRSAEHTHALVLVFHHIAFDGWSVGVFCEELSSAYAAFQRGAQPALPPLPVCYADYSAWEQDRIGSDPSIQRQLEYWKGRLAGLPDQSILPLDHPRPATPSYRGGTETFDLPAALVNQLLALCRRQSASFFMTTLAAFQTLLWRWSGQTDIAVGVPTANRAYPQIENLIGFFVNTLVLRSSLQHNPSFLDFLAQVRQSCFEAYANQEAPFDKVVEALQPARAAHRSPLFQAMFALQNAPSKSLRLAGLQADIEPLPTGAALFDLTLSLEEHGEALKGHLLYNRDLFEPPTVRRLLEHYRRLLEAVAEDPSRPLSSLPLMDAQRRRQVLVDWNATSRPYPQATVADLFQAQAARTPTAVAVVQGSRQWTYAQLNQWANAWAARLRQLGAAPDVPVGLCLERSPEMIAALLAILKAGSAYVPLDPQYPAPRLGFLAADAALPIILTQRRLRSRFPALEGVQWLELEELAALPPQPQDPPPANTPDHLPYILYTSGSTGQPKGVEIPHRAIVRLLFNTNYAHFGPDEVFLHLSPESFDASTLEIWGPLLHGGCCVLYPDRIPTPAGLRTALAAHGVTSLFLTTSLFHSLMDQDPEALSALRQLMFGGETLSTSHALRAFRCLPRTALIHVYGPTEGTVFTTFHRLQEGDGQGGSSIPIGKPIANTTVYILDEHMQPVPPGLPGELYIGGDGLARGYRNRPELTAQAFVPDPFSETPGARLYRSGDIVRWREDGAIEFLGRRDDQVKIRGHRIELGEIETALMAQRGVRLSAVVVREFGPNDKRLAAYYEGSAKPADVRNGLKGLLPEYMLPNYVIALGSLPLLESGKVDRRALAQRPISMAPSAPSRMQTETELALARLFAETLRLPGVNPEDSFFDLGGHSLLAAQLMTRIEAVLGVQLPTSTLFGAPSVRELAHVIAETRQAGSISGLVPLRAGTSGPPLFCIHGMDGSVWLYRSLARNLAAPNPVFGIEARDVSSLADVSMESLARRHAETIRKALPDGPYLLCGFSYGGIVAYEIARQIRESGAHVPLLAILDSSAYVLRSAWSPIQSFLHFSRRFQKRVHSLISGDWTTWLEYARDKRALWLGKIHHHGKRVRQRLGTAIAPNSPPPAMDSTDVLLSLLRSYAPKPYHGDMVLFRPMERSVTDFDPLRGWGRFVKGSIAIREISGDHFSMIDNDVHNRMLAAELSAEIRLRVPDPSG
jgi:amino acid adenylation domain-containing protein